MNINNDSKNQYLLSRINLELVVEDYGGDIEMNSVSDTSSNIDASEIA